MGLTGVLQRATVNLDDDDVVSSDARLARIMQEQERLDAMMRREQKRIRRAQRERQQRERQAIVSLYSVYSCQASSVCLFQLADV